MARFSTDHKATTPILSFPASLVRIPLHLGLRRPVQPSPKSLLQNPPEFSCEGCGPNHRGQQADRQNAHRIALPHLWLSHIRRIGKKSVPWQDRNTSTGLSTYNDGSCSIPTSYCDALSEEMGRAFSHQCFPIATQASPASQVQPGLKHAFGHQIWDQHRVAVPLFRSVKCSRWDRQRVFRAVRRVAIPLPMANGLGFRRKPPRPERSRYLSGPQIGYWVSGGSFVGLRLFRPTKRRLRVWSAAPDSRFQSSASVSRTGYSEYRPFRCESGVSDKRAGRPRSQWSSSVAQNRLDRAGDVSPATNFSSITRRHSWLQGRIASSIDGTGTPRNDFASMEQDFAAPTSDSFPIEQDGGGR